MLWAPWRAHNRRWVSYEVWLWFKCKMWFLDCTIHRPCRDPQLLLILQRRIQGPLEELTKDNTAYMYTTAVIIHVTDTHWICCGSIVWENNLCILKCSVCLVPYVLHLYHRAENCSAETVPAEMWLDFPEGKQKILCSFHRSVLGQKSIINANYNCKLISTVNIYLLNTSQSKVKTLEGSDLLQMPATECGLTAANDAASDCSSAFFDCDISRHINTHARAV